MRTLALCEAKLHFGEAIELESAVETLEPLSFLLNRLLDQLCARLEARALAVQELTLRLQLEPRVADEQTTTLEELSSALTAVPQLSSPGADRVVRRFSAAENPRPNELEPGFNPATPGTMRAQLPRTRFNTVFSLRTPSAVGPSEQVRRSNVNVYTRTLRLPVAMRDPKVFLKLLQLDLAAHPPGAPVCKLWLLCGSRAPPPAE